MNKINAQIFKSINLDSVARKERYFVIDDTIVAKLGRKIENVSYIFDHNRGRSVLGYSDILNECDKREKHGHKIETLSKRG